MNYFNQESERLTFRKITTDDVPSWEEFFEDNDRLHFFGIIEGEKSNRALSVEWVTKQRKRYENDEFGLLAVVRKTTNEMIGMGGILPREVEGQREYEVAYSLKPKHWGNGYATEMAKLMKQFAIENIKPKRLISMIDKENLESIKVAEKNGMKFLFKSTYMEMPIDIYGTDNI